MRKRSRSRQLVELQDKGNKDKTLCCNSFSLNASILLKAFKKKRWKLHIDFIKFNCTSTILTKRKNLWKVPGFLHDRKKKWIQKKKFKAIKSFFLAPLLPFLKKQTNELNDEIINVDFNRILMNLLVTKVEAHQSCNIFKKKAFKSLRCWKDFQLYALNAEKFDKNLPQLIFYWYLCLKLLRNHVNYWLNGASQMLKMEAKTFPSSMLFTCAKYTTCSKKNIEITGNLRKMWEFSRRNKDRW